MSDEKTAKNLTALFSLLPLGLLLIIDLYAMWLQPLGKALSHLAFGVLVAQLLCSLVFLKGDICNGQRGRLSEVHTYFALFWAVWFFLSLFSNYHYVLTDLICLCGMVMVFSAWRQPNEAEMRVGVLKIGVAAGAIGIICYVLMLLDAPSLAWIQYNFAAQALTGIVLTNLALVISRNRLQGFIALLPLLMIIVLLINAIAVLSILAIHHFSVVDGQSAVVFSNDFAFILYFSLHLVIAAILAVHIFRKIKLEYPVLMILLTISASLPLWSTFAYIS